MRSASEIREREHELAERMWYVVHGELETAGRNGGDVVIAAQALTAAASIREKYGPSVDEPLEDPHALGFLEGQLSMVRWCLGQDEGLLDT